MYTGFGTKRDIENVMEQIGEQIGSFIQQVSKEMPNFAQRQQAPQAQQPETEPARHDAQNWPQIDVEEDDFGVYIYAELPGMEKSDIEIVIGQDNVLKIRGEKKYVSRPGTKRITSERRLGAFTRLVALPEQIDAATVQAEFTNGLLSISVGKKAQAQGIRVEIR